MITTYKTFLLASFVALYDDLYGHAPPSKSSREGISVSGLAARDEAGRAVETPLPNAADVQMDEVRVRIVAHTAASQSESSLAQFERVDAGHPQVNSFRLNVKAVPCNSRGMSSERLVSRRGAVAADDVDLAAWTADRRGEIREDIVQAWINMTNIAGPMIAQEKIELAERFRNVCVAPAVNDVNPLSGVGVVKQKEMIVAIMRG